jgi:hypothetical protein
MIKKKEQKEGSFTLEGLSPLWLTLGWSITAEYNNDGTLIYAEVNKGWGIARSPKKRSALWMYCEDMGKKWL